MAAAVVLFATISLSHSWNTWRKAAYSTAPFLHTDALAYVTLMRTADPSALEAPFRYRVLTPWLARLVPPPPAWLLAKPRSLAADELAVWRFALVNAAGLALAASFLFLLLGRLGFTLWERLAGSLFLLVSHIPSGTVTAPRVDAWGFALLAGGLWGLLARRWEVVALTFALGLFNKETIVLVPIAAVLLRDWSSRERWILTACFVPPAVVYAIFRFYAFPAGEVLHSGEWYLAWADRLFRSPGIVAIPKDLFASFGVLWIAAAIGWARVDRGTPLARWSPLIPLVLVAPFLLIKTLASSWFYLFPVVIPLALLGIRTLFERSDTPMRSRQA